MLDSGKEAEAIAHGGAWWVIVEKANAELLGCVLAPEIQQMVDAHEEGFKRWVEAIKRMSGSMSPKERERLDRHREANAHGRICGCCGKPLAPDAVVVRDWVPTKGFLGRPGAQLVLNCFDCNRSAVFLCRGNCEGCGRKVYFPSRRNRRHVFCCDDCRKRAKSDRARARAVNPAGPSKIENKPFAKLYG
jgi:hypothetical protein